jgi:hypothetical protein
LIGLILGVFKFVLVCYIESLSEMSLL